MEFIIEFNLKTLLGIKTTVQELQTIEKDKQEISTKINQFSNDP